MLFLLLSLLSLSEAGQSCSSCKVALTSYQVWVNSDKNTIRLTNFINNICSETWSPSNCFPFLSSILPELNEAIQQRIMNPDRFCSLINACDSPVYTKENFTEWEESIMQGASEYFEPTTGESYFNFVQLSDIHLDMKYVEGSSYTCSSQPCCRGAQGATDAAGKWGNYNCDLPQETLDSVVTFLATQNLDFIIWTGDTAAHDISLSKDEKLNSIKAVTNLLWSKFNNIVPVYPIFGNEECYLDHQYNFVGTNWLASGVAALWKPWIGQTAATNLQNNGRYSLIHRNTNLKIIAINTLACDMSNFWLLSNVTDPGNNLEFLRSELASAEANNQYVYILGHVPPASDICMSLWSKHYQVLIRRYANIIRGQFFGHTHNDEFRISRAQDGTAIGIQFFAPSLDPLYYHNPSFRIYTADYLSKSMINYKQYRMDLADESPSFYEAYEFKDYYLVKNMFPGTIEKLINNMKDVEMAMMKYVSNKFTASPATPVGCDEQCRSDTYCEMAYDRPDTIRKCKGLLPSPAQLILEYVYGSWIYKS